MTSSNASRVHQYLQAVAAMGAPETVADFFAPDVIFHEFPNRIVPQGPCQSLRRSRHRVSTGSETP